MSVPFRRRRLQTNHWIRADLLQGTRSNSRDHHWCWRWGAWRSTDSSVELTKIATSLWRQRKRPVVSSIAVHDEGQFCRTWGTATAAFGTREPPR
jgi:hypothetical protein